ncbi:MAG TPA: hypothetical protein VHM26_06000, partial [Chitinophagaceae bacterium]|nr:hypothetical protein [Chitinophagaceae bacterium]
MRKYILLKLLVMITIGVSAQKETFDILSYNLPGGWQKQSHDNGLQLSVVDNKTGGYVAVIVTKSVSSDLSANENFTDHWSKLVKAAVMVTQEPTMIAPSKDKDWDVISGQANYTDGNNKGIVTQITATGYGKVISLVAMTNTEKFKEDLTQLFSSLELTELANTQTTNKPTTNGGASIVGMWVHYINETSGYINNIPQLTAGYFRKQYQFNSDGTYQFLEKTWSVYMKDIFFAYETGKWSMNGNKLTITPTKGKNESWSKAASNRTTEWGSLVKSTNRKLETITYTIELKYLSGMQEPHLLLRYGKDTERDGTRTNDNDSYWTYSPRPAAKGSLVDLP